MHLRKLTLTVGLFGSLFSTWALGLGLGEITLKSKLNQPLDAEIKLLQVRNLSEEDIIVELASTADFQRFGIDRLYFLHNLKFDVQLDHPGGPIVRVRSDEPVREPYLVFLVQAQSPSSGRLLREYTLLLDLPVFTAEAPAPIQAPARQTQTAQIETEPAIRAPSAPATTAPRTVQREGEPYRAPPAPGRSTRQQPASFDGNVYGPIQANDTLWDIASRVRPSGVSIQQSMLALQRANPDAFINGNINLLKRGQVLRVPEEHEWLSLDQQTAIREVAFQNEQWRSGRFESSGAELAASSSRPSRQRGSEAPRGQLTLSAPSAVDQAGETSGAGSTAGGRELLENELAIVSEQLDAARRENQELSSRIVELEEQIATMERLLEVSSAELRALQLAADQDVTAEELAVEAPEEEAETSSAVGEEVEAEEAVTAEAEEVSATAEEADAATATAPATKVVTRRAPEPTLLDKIMSQIWYVVAGALAIVAGLAYFLFRRRQEEGEWESFEDDDIFADPDAGHAGDELLEESAGLDGLSSLDSLDDAAAEAEGASQPIAPETGDAVAEADIYIAYGKLDQAAEMLRNALAADPDNVDARIKLLEVYVEQNDVESFDEEYRILLSSGNAGASSRAAELRSGIADAPPFVGDDLGEPAEPVAADEAFALETETEEQGLADSDFGDLELSFDLDGEDSEASGESSGLELDLDLGSDFEQEDAEEESADSDSGFDFELLGSTDEQSDDTDGLGDFELNLDGEALELDGSFEAEDTATEEAADDFSLDLDLDLEPQTATDDSDDFEFNLLSEDEEQDADDLNLDLDTLEVEQEPAAELTLELDDEQEEVSLEVSALDDAAQQEQDLLTLDTAADTADDAFDVELGDLDLEALDREMDALVGAVDDEDVELAEPLTLTGQEEDEPATEEEPEEALDLDLQLNGAGTVDATALADENPFSEDQDFDPDDLEDEFDFLSDSDEVATKLDLARAYIDMGDQEGARDILDEVSAEGNEEQKREAQALLEKMV